LSRRLILAHDLGTTGNKATLFDEAGTLLGSAFYAYETDFPQTGWAEQSPEDWWRAVCETTHELIYKTAISGHDVACVTFSGQMQAAVPVDRDGLPLRSAIIWMDQRATEQSARLAETISIQDVYKITGHRLSPAYSLAKILWIRDHQPDLFTRTYKFLTAKDAIIARMTGRFATEPSDASGMNLYDLVEGGWSAPILAASGLAIDQLPEILPSTAVAGGIRDSIAAEVGLPAGTPVVMGGGDGACAAVGSGAVAEGVTFSYIGSSSWVSTATASPLIDHTMRIFTFGHVVPGLYLPMGTMQTAGAAYQWARDQLGLLEMDAAQRLEVNVYELMNLIAAKSPPGANNLLFLPYLVGERAPRWNPNARANFIGLTIRHTRADMFRAVLEGVAYNLRCILDILQTQAGAILAIRAIGGGTTGRLWTQIMADVYGIPLQRLVTLESATSMGAAVVGGVGVGVYPGFAMAGSINPVAEVVEPNAANHATYERLVAIFDQTYQALLPIFDALASS
jgi:xylulokinase